MGQAEESIAQLWRLTEVKQIKNRRKYQTDSDISKKPVKNLGKTLPSIASTAKQTRGLTHLVKRQTTGSHGSVHAWFGHQKPTRMGLHCKARWDHNPVPSIAHNIRLDNENGSSHACFPQHDFEKWKSHYTCNSSRRLNKLRPTTKGE